MIEFNKVTRRFGDIDAVRDLSFEIKAGEIIGLLGANGAGKTTTMRLMTGYFPPSEGEVRIADRPLREDPLGAKRLIGYLPEKLPLYDEMVVHDYLRFIAGLKEVPADRIEPSIERVLDQLDISDHAGRLVGNLSRGYRQRVALAQALVHQPQILILDEPTIGLDPVQVRRLRELIEDLALDTTLIISSHILPEIRQICERVIILKEGRMVAVDSTEKLITASEGGIWECLFDSTPEDWQSQLTSLEPVRSASPNEAGLWRIDFGTDDYEGRRALFELCRESNVPILSLRRPEYDLEEIFFELTHDTEEGSGDHEST